MVTFRFTQSVIVLLHTYYKNCIPYQTTIEKKVIGTKQYDLIHYLNKTLHVI